MQLIQALVIVFVMRGGVLYIYVNYMIVVYAESPVAHALMYKLDGPRPQARCEHSVCGNRRAATLYVA